MPGLGLMMMAGRRRSSGTPAASAPVNISVPVISGTAVEGATVTCSTGSWSNSPTSFTYQWTRNGSNISGATASTRVLSTTDVGADIACVVTATNATGSTSATAAAVVPTAIGNAPAFVGVSGGSLVSGASWPASYTPTAGHYAIIALYDANVIRTVAGWATLSSASSSGTSTTFGSVYGKSLVGGDALPSITGDGGWAMVVVSGAASAEAVTTTVTGVGTSHVLSMGATSGARRRVSFIGCDQLAASFIAPPNFTAPSGWTERYDDQGANQVSVGAADIGTAGADSGGTITWTSNFSEACVGFTIALSPESAPPPPPPSTLDPIWVGDFETGNSSQYLNVLATAGRITYPTSPVLQGTRSGRFELRPGDTWTDGTNRCQLRGLAGASDGANFWTQGKDMYFRYGMYIDPSLTIGASFSNPWRVTVAWPSADDGLFSPLKYALHRELNGGANPSGTDAITLAGDNGVSGAPDVTKWRLQNPVKGQWYEFIAHIFFHSDAATGRWENWMKAPGSSTFVKQTFLNGSQTLIMRTLSGATHRANLRLGLYRSSSFTTTDVVYYDNVMWGTSFAAVGGS